MIVQVKPRPYAKETVKWLCYQERWRCENRGVIDGLDALEIRGPEREVLALIYGQIDRVLPAAGEA